MSKEITRRDFMRRTAYAALAAGIGADALGTRSRVVLVRSKTINEKTVKQMLDRALMSLTGMNDPLAAFKRFIKPADVVGLKTNVWPYIPTPKEIEKAIYLKVRGVGVNPENISFDDRGVLDNPVFKKATAMINMRPLRTHYWSGIGGCIKNMITFTPRPYHYHPDSCADLALVWKLPEVKNKVRLNILSALTPLYHGRGPHHYDSRYVWAYNGLIVGQDPVAVDAVGLEIIKAKRREHFGKEVKFQTLPKHIRQADVRHDLGVSDLKRIDLIKLDWQKDILI